MKEPSGIEPAAAAEQIDSALNLTAALVTRPLLPPLEEFLPYLQEIWENRWLTNSGPFLRELQLALELYLGVEHIALVANGTAALILAVQALKLTGEVITTPFSFVATTHSLRLNGLQPVFADIDPGTYNLDPDAIERAITPRTTAIMPVHCFGKPCDVDGIQKVADKHGLKVIYDAAHAFGVRRGGESVLRHGDLSTLSFHATKVFNTFEGGAIVCQDAAMKDRIYRLANFGFEGDVTTEVGTNAKMNEIQAAFGMLQLKHVDAAIAARGAIDARYRDGLANVPGIRCLPFAVGEQSNHSYFPILVEEGYPLDREGLFTRLTENGAMARRYFYPLISDMPVYRDIPSAQDLPVAKTVADRVLCLPIYPDLPLATVDRIVGVIAGA